MPQTLIVDDRVSALEGAVPEGDSLWVPLDALESATGWALKPEGACRGEECVPIPPGRQGEFVRPGAFNVTALAAHLNQPVLHDAAHGAWLVAESAERRAFPLRSLEAPDFTLPDLAGNPHSLHDYRGRKVFLVSWGSW